MVFYIIYRGFLEFEGMLREYNSYSIFVSGIMKVVRKNTPKQHLTEIIYILKSIRLVSLLVV